MRLRLALASAVLAVLVASPAIAQGPPGGGMGGMGQRGPGRRMQMLFTGITLTSQQQAKVDSIEATYQPRMRQLFQAGGMGDSSTRAQMATLRAQENRDLRAVLTREQQGVFDKNVAAMPAMGGPRRGPPGGR